MGLVVAPIALKQLSGGRGITSSCPGPFQRTESNSVSSCEECGGGRLSFFVAPVGTRYSRHFVWCRPAPAGGCEEKLRRHTYACRAFYTSFTIGGEVSLVRRSAGLQHMASASGAVGRACSACTFLCEDVERVNCEICGCELPLLQSRRPSFQLQQRPAALTCVSSFAHHAR